MKWPQIPKQVVLPITGIVLIGGVILAAEVKREDGKGASKHPPGGAQPAASADDDDEPKPRSKHPVCPTRPAVEDPTLGPTAEQLKPRFSSGTCLKNEGGIITACVDASPAACEQRVAGVRKFFKNAGACVPKPDEVFCASLVTAGDDTKVLCFDTNDRCEEYRQSKSKRTKICRVSPKCQQIKI